MINYDYSRVMGACCENDIGYMPLPLGIAGPLKVDGVMYPIPMATAEGTLVASTSRGCKALNAGGGVTTVLTYDGMTRGPAIDFPSIVVAAEAKAWIESVDGYAIVKEAFESTSRFAKLQNIKCAMAGRTLFVRFATRTGDAIGGLLNATFGNAPELIIALVALKAGYFDMVRASIIGAILANLLLAMGVGFFLGGLRYHTQEYNAGAARLYSSMMLISAISRMISRR